MIADIRKFKADNELDRLVMVWCGSTEVFMTESPAHQTIESFEKALEQNDPSIPSSMVYAYAAIREGIPYANAAPNLTADIPALVDLAATTEGAAGGEGPEDRADADQDDHRARASRRGCSASKAGTRPTSSATATAKCSTIPSRSRRRKRARSRSSTTSCSRSSIRTSTQDLCHVVRINYYPPRGDNKEGWDNIDLVGWLGYPMQLKINFLCRDSILAAPIVLDVALFLDLAKRAGMHGIQEWLSFYFKSPVHAPGLYPEHDLFIQLMKLKNTLRYLKGEELITHLGREYYD